MGRLFDQRQRFRGLRNPQGMDGLVELRQGLPNPIPVIFEYPGGLHQQGQALLHVSPTHVDQGPIQPKTSQFQCISLLPENSLGPITGSPCLVQQVQPKINLALVQVDISYGNWLMGPAEDLTRLIQET